MGGRAASLEWCPHEGSTLPWRDGFYCAARLSANLSARRNPKPSSGLAGNLWLSLSILVEPGPKSLCFPPVTTSVHSAAQTLLVLSARTMSGRH